MHLRSLVNDGHVELQRPQLAHERARQRGAHHRRLLHDLVHRALLPLPLLLLQRPKLSPQRPPLRIVLHLEKNSVERQPRFIGTVALSMVKITGVSATIVILS